MEKCVNASIVVSPTTNDAVFNFQPSDTQSARLLRAAIRALQKLHSEENVGTITMTVSQPSNDCLPAGVWDDCQKCIAPKANPKRPPSERRARKGSPTPALLAAATDEDDGDVVIGTPIVAAPAPAAAAAVTAPSRKRRRVTADCKKDAESDSVACKTCGR